jgi:hypothetical protein
VRGQVDEGEEGLLRNLEEQQTRKPQQQERRADNEASSNTKTTAQTYQKANQGSSKGTHEAANETANVRSHGGVASRFYPDAVSANFHFKIAHRCANDPAHKRGHDAKGDVSLSDERTDLATNNCDANRGSDLGAHATTHERHQYAGADKRAGHPIDDVCTDCRAHAAAHRGGADLARSNGSVDLESPYQSARNFASTDERANLEGTNQRT